MACRACTTAPVLDRRYSGERLCQRHFVSAVEKSVQRELRQQVSALEASGESLQRIAVALSGGKDSTVALRLVQAWAVQRRLELVALAIDEGIAGYRAPALECARRGCDALGVELRVSSYRDLVGMGLDELLQAQPSAGSPCSPCGILRRRALNFAARDAGVDALVLGHNLDDCAQTVLMNHARGDVARLQRMAPHLHRQPGMVPRLLPLRRIPEQEVYLLALLQGWEFHTGDCPHAAAAQRNLFRDLLLQLEQAQPGTRHGLLRGMDRMRESLEAPQPLARCPTCGEPAGSAGECQFCRRFGAFAV
jgi:uncharacterized protein (TIGR00269 family)